MNPLESDSMKRKPIQISQSLFLDEKSSRLMKRPICLCDDGTIWELVQGSWELLPSIPQIKYEVLVKSEREIK